MSHTTVTSVPVSFDDAGHGGPALAYLTGWCSTRTSYAARAEHTARTHFPMLEQPAELAADVTRFAGSLGSKPSQPAQHA